MGIQIVSLFPTCKECHETEDPSVGLYLHLDEQGICSECRQTLMAYTTEMKHASRVWNAIFEGRENRELQKTLRMFQEMGFIE